VGLKSSWGLGRVLVGLSSELMMSFIDFAQDGIHFRLGNLIAGWGGSESVNPSPPPEREAGGRTNMVKARLGEEADFYTAR
jgi:hypothetical protein